MILGESGTGKSELVANALLHGATLIADDQLTLHSEGGALYAEGMPELKGVLEIRHFGLIRYCQNIRAHPIHLVLELNAQASLERLPELMKRDMCGMMVPYIQLPPVSAPMMASLLLYLVATHEKRVLPTDWRP